MAVAGNVFKIVVVKVGITNVVSAGIALIDVVKEIMMNGHASGDIVGPTDTEGFVVTAENGPAYGEVGGILAAI